MHTIKQKLTAFFLVCLAFVGIVTFFYYRNIFSLETRLFTIERFDDLQGTILELRRYEKNYLLYRKPVDQQELKAYLQRAEALCRELADDIRRTAGQAKLDQFRHRLEEYQESLQLTLLLTDQGRVGEKDLALLRARGKALVETTEELIRLERQHVRRALKGIVTIPLVLVGLFVLVVVLIFRVVAVQILQPLALVRKATDLVARDTFTPIAYRPRRKDEVSQLIAAFNKMAEELESRQAQLLQSRKMASVGILTSGVAHELNNPLNNISLTAETLLNEYRDLPPQEVEELLSDIMEQAERGSEVVKKLLEFSRIDPNPRRVRIDLGEVVQSTLKLVRNQLMVSGIRLHTHFEEGLPPIWGKRQDLQQAFLNILVNAIQAMPEGGDLTVRVGRDGQGMLRVDIADTGVGIKQEDLAHIFDPFFTTKPVGQGTGLGLSLTYGIVRNHGGHIEVKGEVGKGTEFSIYLPQAGTEEEKEDHA
jgi:signal transduction histidine kinase